MELITTSPHGSAQKPTTASGSSGRRLIKPEMTFMLDPQWTVLSVNPTGRQLGYTVDELLGESFEGFAEKTGCRCDD